MNENRQEKLKSFTLSMPSYLANKRKITLNPLSTNSPTKPINRHNSEVFKLPFINQARSRIESCDIIYSPKDLSISPKSVKNSPKSEKFLPYIYAQNGLEKTKELMPEFKYTREFILPVSRKECSVDILQEFKSKNSPLDLISRCRSYEILEKI